MFTYATKPQQRQTAAAGKTNAVRLSRQGRSPRNASTMVLTAPIEPVAEFNRRLLRPGVEARIQSLARAVSAGAPPVTLQPGVEARIQSLRGNGEPLPELVRGRMEAALGADFSLVA